MKLVDDWKQGLKFWSTQLNAAGIFLLIFAEYLQTAWSFLPPSLSQHMPYAKEVALILFILGLLARFLKQKDVSNGKPEQS